MDFKLIDMRLLLILFVFCSCSATKSLHNGLSSKGFKDRALCKCLALGLDSTQTNASIQKIIPFDPISTVLFDTAIQESLKPVLKEMYIDSIQRVHSVSESAQGKPVFYFCMRYYESKELSKLARKEVKKAKKIKDLDEYISLRFPTY